MAHWFPREFRSSHTLLSGPKESFPGVGAVTSGEVPPPLTVQEMSLHAERCMVTAASMAPLEGLLVTQLWVQFREWSRAPRTRASPKALSVAVSGDLGLERESSRGKLKSKSVQ